MSGIGQYLKDTQGEMRHVAWPTRTQTVVYTILVAAISVFVAVYLGVFDYLFTTTLARFLEAMPSRSQTPSGLIISTSTVLLPSATSTQ